MMLNKAVIYKYLSMLCSVGLMIMTIAPISCQTIKPARAGSGISDSGSLN